MKRFFSVILIFVMALSCMTCVCAQEEPVAVYSFGEIQGELIPEEIITLPVYLTLKNELVMATVFKIEYDSDKLELQKFKTSEGKGEHSLSGYLVGVDKDNPSLLGVSIYDTKNVSMDNTLLIKIKFKVKNNITTGNMSFDVVFSQISYAHEITEAQTKSFDCEGMTVYIEGNSSDGSGEETQAPDTDDKETDEKGNSEQNPDDDTEYYPEDEPETDNKEITSDSSRPSKKEESEIVPETSAPEFSDLAGYEWAKDYIIPLATKGIIRGTSETTFSPANNITRADFMVLLMRLLDINGTKTNGFTDVPAESYFASAVTSAKELGIAKGGSDGKFNPYNSITREDLCVLVYRALVSKAFLPVVSDDGTFNTKFKDVSIISDYAYDAMHELYLNEIIGGSDGMINPKGFATRAETAVIMFRISRIIPEI